MPYPTAVMSTHTLVSQLWMDSHVFRPVSSPEIYYGKFLAICEGLQDYYHIYTDGSKMNK